MKAYAFVESEMPLPAAGPAAEAFAEVASRMVHAAELVADELRNAVRRARYGQNAKNESAPLAAIYETFWGATGDRFFTLLPRPGDVEWEAALAAVARPWLGTLRETALQLFDEAAPLDPSSFSFTPQDRRRPGSQIPRIIEARQSLLNTVSGYGIAGTKLFSELELPMPERAARRTGRKRAA